MVVSCFWLAALLAIINSTTALSTPPVKSRNSHNLRRDDSFVSPDPEIGSAPEGCEYVWTPTLSGDNDQVRLYTDDGLDYHEIIPSVWMKDVALGAATVGLLISAQWEPQMWAWIDESSSKTFVRVDLQGPSGTVIISDWLPKGQPGNNMDICSAYFGFDTPKDADETGPEILYMALLEKAMAVAQGGNYAALNGLSANDAFLVLTDQPGTVVEGSVGSANEGLLTTIVDAVTNGQPCVVEFILPSDLPSFDSYDPDTGDVKLAIGTLSPATGFETSFIELDTSDGEYFFAGAPAMYTSFKTTEEGVYFYDTYRYVTTPLSICEMVFSRFTVADG